MTPLDFRFRWSYNNDDDDDEDDDEDGPAVVVVVGSEGVDRKKTKRAVRWILE